MFKSKKRITGLFSLTILLVLASVAWVKAETSTTEDEAYTVTIPAEVAVDPATKSGEINISATLDPYSKLEIEVASQHNYNLECGSRKLNYTLTGTGFSNNKITYTTENSSELEDGSQKTFSSTLTANMNSVTEALVSGIYEDTLTFTFDCEENYPENAHKLIYNANGGEVNTARKIITTGTAYGTLEIPVRKGYKFEGWFTQATGGTQVTAKTVMESTDTTIYAHWTAYTLTVNYHNDHAQYWRKFSDEKQIVLTDDYEIVEKEVTKYDAVYPHAKYGLLDVNRFTKTGYHSGLKWKIGSVDSDKYVDDVQDTKLDENTKSQDIAKSLGVLSQFETQNVTVELYPVFVANTYIIVFNANGATNGTMQSVVCTYDINRTLPVNQYTKDNSSFTGWNTKPDGTGTTYADQAMVKNLTATNNATITLYAQWQEISATANLSADEAESDSQVAAEEPQTNLSSDSNAFTEDIISMDETNSAESTPESESESQPESETSAGSEGASEPEASEEPNTTTEDVSEPAPETSAEPDMASADEEATEALSEAESAVEGE